MRKLILFHGTFGKEVVQTYDKGSERHDYGMEIYLAEGVELAKEWAICRPNETSG